MQFFGDVIDRFIGLSVFLAANYILGACRMQVVEDGNKASYIVLAAKSHHDAKRWQCAGSFGTSNRQLLRKQGCSLVL